MSTTATAQKPVVPAVLAQHLDDAVSLRSVRSVLLRAPHVKLKDLARADERLAAHLDGLSIAGDAGAALSREALDLPGVGQLFVCCVLAIERRDAAQLTQLVSLLEPVPDAARALSSAFGWVSAPLLRGLTAPLLQAPSPRMRWLGLVACAQHRVDPGRALDEAVKDADAALRARALQAAGELARVDLLPSCLDRLSDEAPTVALAAARAAVLLGDREHAPRVLLAWASTPGPLQHGALLPALLASDAGTARSLVRQMAASGSDTRTVIRAAGLAGDAQAVPWLLKHMASPDHARLAGEAFSFITGVNLKWQHLDGEPPEEAAGGPNDDPRDERVALDEDDDLPWPDVAKLTAWWHTHGSRFAAGQRHFVGESPSVAHALAVLGQGMQRQRLVAAVHLSLLQPGTPLFNIAAPASRQRQQLARLGVTS
ncbi:TIGR02270 family protein [Piscinibacter sp. HJYY11]|uniref:TIGR02270 family protein n=1 Tax=Piscinibacter sp. HJYY11 TaxID=2801333 RepID=UPI001920238F|nr:TIGR02270 family protein [Piscinibacter sp. HJYY11]MBL0726377.1 TIGR02270 family protein [Piscinibacter sp. HJYY11]